jgi:hypothetical protein
MSHIVYHNCISVHNSLHAGLSVYSWATFGYPKYKNRAEKNVNLQRHCFNLVLECAENRKHNIHYKYASIVVLLHLTAALRYCRLKVPKSEIFDRSDSPDF